MLANDKLKSLALFAFTALGMTIISVPINLASGLNFGAVGDWGCNSNTQKTRDNMKNHGADRIFALGDYSYQSTATCWLNIISSVKSITRIAIGNHEDDSNEGFSQYMNAFGLSSTVYVLTYGNPGELLVVVMDSDRNSFSKGSSQYNFVEQQLKKSFKWKIVYLHKQMYTSPNTCGSSSCSNTGSDATNLRNIYHPLFDQYGVDLVLTGHLHNFQRTFPIKYDSGSPSSPTVTSTSSTEYTDPAGQIYAVVGTGGINFHALSGKSSFVKYQQDDRFGALDISLENSGNTLAGRYYTNDGVKRDTFKINKGVALAQYTFGPSLSLSGEEPSLTPSGGDSILKNSLDSAKNTFQPNGQGLGLNCEHFSQEGPMRCR